MKQVHCFLLLLIAGMLTQQSLAQADTSRQLSPLTQYAFVVGTSKDNTKAYFSPVYAIPLNEQAIILCDVRTLIDNYGKKVADKSWYVTTSGYYDTPEETERIRELYIASRKKQGQTVTVLTTPVGECSVD